MEKEKILSEIQTVFRDVLNNEYIVLEATTTASDVEGWDSLTYIQLIVAIEKHFKIKFTSKEIFFWKNIGEMIDNIQNK